jgi:zinc protease
MIRAAFIALALAGPVLTTAARAEIEVVSVTSPGGIKAWLYEDYTIPIIMIDAAFLGGASLDAKGREGTTYLMAALLDQGGG